MKNNRKGFTLAELLIVVAIIAVLVAIAIPIFTSQLERAREATDLANIRSAYAEAAINALTGDGEDGTAESVPMVQESGWDYLDNHIAGVDTDIPDVEEGDVVAVTVPVSGEVSFDVK